MGQYHKVLNVDKKQFIHGHLIDNGLKLMEQCGFEKCSATALFLLVANSNGRGGGDAKKNPLIGTWSGDRVVVQGDYAEPEDQGFVSENDFKDYTDISSQVKQMLDNEFD